MLNFLFDNYQSVTQEYRIMLKSSTLRNDLKPMLIFKFEMLNDIWIQESLL